MLFIILLSIITLTLATSAAYFSVWGMAQLFAGAFIPVIIMGSSLEAGKLIAASFLYRNWNDIGYLLRTYLISAIFILMLITSMGIFGFLTAAYQKDTLPLTETVQLIESYESELDVLSKRKAEIDAQISAMPATYVTAKQRLISTFETELKNITPRIEFLTTETQKLKIQSLNIQTKIGPIIFISEALGKDSTDAMMFFVLLLIIVFDPLAIALTIATNVAITKRRKTVVDIASPIQSTAAASISIPEEILNMATEFKIRSEIEKNIRSV